ncbi:MAG: O-antigen ligase family protein [Planctomycetota bacterium]|nr:O-antigen ligase family protein [Planctomycetota bacterium]
MFAVVAGLSVYAWRDWFRTLCGLILLTAFIGDENMPRSIMGIQGLSPWNILMFSVVLSWAVSRRREDLVWDMPRHVTVLLLLYLGVVLVGFARMMADRSHLGDITTASLISEQLINTIKWVVPGLLLYDGCRSPRRTKMALWCILAVYLCIALQVVYITAVGAEFGDDAARLVHTRITMDVGISRAMTATMLAGSAWAFLTLLPVLARPAHKMLAAGAFALMTWAEALLRIRSGYCAWGFVGLVLCLVRWQRYLLVLPAGVLLLAFVFPGARARLLQGVGEIDPSGQAVINEESVTSGRNLIWPYVVDKISESPIVGYGREAMRRTGLQSILLAQVGPGVAMRHPHNAYLEVLLDNGLVGFLVVIPFFLCVIEYAALLFRARDAPWTSAVGGVALALVLSHLAAGIGAQSFYPCEGDCTMWCAIMLMLRVRVDRTRSKGFRPAQAAGLSRPLRPWLLHQTT